LIVANLSHPVDGFNSTLPILRASLSGHGLAYIPEDVALPHIARGELVRVLDD
jgi:DNA-binding transcriptional LysR family regulator